MNNSLSEMTDSYLRKLYPFMFSLLFVLINNMPIHIPFSHFLRPDVAMACIYFWTFYRADLFSVAAVVALAILTDMLSASPLGLNLFAYLCVYLLTKVFANYINSGSFIISWVGFALIALFVFGIKWLLMSCYVRTFLGFNNILLTLLTTLLIYPLIARINIFLQNRYLISDEVIDE